MPETIASPTVELRPPPAALMRVVNPLMRRIIRSRFGPKMAPLAVLRFEGRRTGRRRDIPVGLHEIDGAHAVFTDRPWRLNFRQTATVTVLQRGETWSATAELIDDPERVGPALAAAVAREGARKLGLAVHGDQTPTAADFAATGKSMVLIRSGPTTS